MGMIIGLLLILKIEGQQNDITLEILQSLQNKIDAVAATNSKSLIFHLKTWNILFSKRKFNSIKFNSEIQFSLIIISENYQDQINTLNGQLQALAVKENNDYTALTTVVNNLGRDVAGALARIDATDAGLRSALSKVAILEADLADTQSKIVKLEGVNRIWKANFQVVNRTFAELKRKLKLTIPVLQLPNLVVRPG